MPGAASGQPGQPRTAWSANNSALAKAFRLKQQFQPCLVPDNGYHILLVVCDVFTRFIWAEALKSKHSIQVKEGLNRILHSKQLKDLSVQEVESDKES